MARVFLPSKWRRVKNGVWEGVGVPLTPLASGPVTAMDGTSGETPVMKGVMKRNVYQAKQVDPSGAFERCVVGGDI